MPTPITEVTIVRRCGRCRYEIGTLTVKKDNMRLMTSELAWCDHCGSEQPETRDIAGRDDAVADEQSSYPGNPPVKNLSAAEYRRRRAAIALGILPAKPGSRAR